MGDMKSWAENEINLAIERYEADNGGDREFGYMTDCYKSAIKAYNSLMEDGHSGMSFSYTKNILIRLMEGLPIIPIQDEDFKPSGRFESEYLLKSRGLKDNIQCPRMSSLFKSIYLDGTIKYSDVHRAMTYDVNNPRYGWSSSLITKLIDEMYPITMPYYPPSSEYKVYVDEFLTDTKNGDFDTVGIIYLITPKYEKVEVNRYFKADGNEPWTEISKEEYDTRSNNRIE